MGTMRSLAGVRPIMMTSKKSISDLYEHNYSAVYGTALRVTGNAADAEDVLQTVFLRLVKRKDPPEPENLSEAYFRRAAANAAVDLLRRRVTRAETELQEVSSRPSKDDPSLLKEELRRALASLKEEDAALFLLRFVEGLSNEELASLFGQEKNHIAVRLHRIRQTLQAEMGR
jgi:RNA polymerase sigma factor (sigma-70 family)